MQNEPEQLGTVISTMEGPNTTSFDFVLGSKRVKKGQFVQVKTEEGSALGSVSEIARSNRYFERPESVNEYSRIGGELSVKFPTGEWEFTVAKVNVHGVLTKDNMLSRASYPVQPGSGVHEADIGQLKAFLKIDEKGLDIGTLAHHELKVKVSLSRLLQKHLAILAMSGSGKSYLAGVLMEELLDRKAENGRLAVVAIDNHGEYSIYKDSFYRDRVQVFEGKKIKIGLRNLSPSQLEEWSRISSAAKRGLEKHFNLLKKEMKENGVAKGIEELIDSVSSDPDYDKKENVRGPLLAALNELSRLRLISKSDSIKMSDCIKPGTLTVIDLSSIDDLRKKQMIVAYYSKKLFKMRKKGAIPPYAMIVEEAHNFCREKIDRNLALSKGIIETLAREGRKFGASLCLISQRPVQLSTTALSQCNSNIILRITNPFDLKHIGESCEGIDGSMLDSITSLRVGEALILGEAVGAPIFVKVRKRRAELKQKGESLESIAQEYEEKSRVKEDEIEAFL